MLNDTKFSSICTNGIPESGRKRKSKDTLTDNFPNLMITTHPQI